MVTASCKAHTMRRCWRRTSTLWRLGHLRRHHRFRAGVVFYGLACLWCRDASVHMVVHRRSLLCCKDSGSTSITWETLGIMAKSCMICFPQLVHFPVEDGATYRLFAAGTTRVADTAGIASCTALSDTTERISVIVLTSDFAPGSV